MIPRSTCRRPTSLYVALLLFYSAQCFILVPLQNPHFSTTFEDNRLQPCQSMNIASSTDSLLSTTDIVPITVTHKKIVSTSVVSSNDKPSWTDDGFVFGLSGSGLERPKGRVASLVVDGDTLESQPYQVTMVVATFVGHALLLAWTLSQMIKVNGGSIQWTSLQALTLALSSWILADFGSGVLHWSVDNYGNGRTPVMGGIIAAFQGHHSAPWTITQRDFCNNVWKLCIPFGPVPLLILSCMSALGPFVTYFWTVFFVLEILSQEFHKWSHQLKSEAPRWANALQNLGFTIGRKPHALHHLAPYDGNYCIISGVCNPFLDENGFFRRLEHVLYQLNGVEPNAWKLDANLKERTLSGKYGLDISIK